MKFFLFFFFASGLTSCRKSAGNAAQGPGDCAGRYQSQLFSSVTASFNIPYGRAQNISGMPEDLLLDIYEPAGDTAAKRAMIIFVHGGGWTEGTKSQGRELCTYFGKKGYVAATIDYRLGIENPVNEKTRGEAVYRGVQDLKAAVRFARARASQYRIDTAQIFIGGYSAGGVNAIHTAYWDEAEVPADIDKTKWGSLEGDGGNGGFSSNVHTVFAIAGAITDLSWIQTGEAPVLCINSKTDQVIPYGSGIDGKGIFVYGGVSIVPKATSLNIAATLYTYENIAHGEYLQPANFTTTITAVDNFLSKHARCN